MSVISSTVLAIAVAVALAAGAPLLPLVLGTVVADSLVRPTVEHRWAARFLSFSRTASAAVILIGSLVLVGWAADLDPLKSLVPGQVAMNPATALGFILCGASLWQLRSEERGPQHALRVARCCAVLVVMLALLRIGGYAFGRDPYVDQLLFRGRTILEENRMAPNTALAFFFVGLALTLLVTEFAYGFRLAQFLLSATALLALLALVGYAYSIAFLYRIPNFIPMALNTALAFLVLCAGIVCTYPHRGPMAIVVSENGGGVIARRLLPAAVLLPLALGAVVLLGQRVGVYGPPMPFALLTVLNMAMFTTLALTTAVTVHRSDLERRRAEEDLRTAHAALELRVRERTAELSKTNAELQAEIAERKQTEIALRTSKARLRRLVDSNIIGINFGDLAGAVWDANDAFLQLVGYTREDLRSGQLRWRDITPAEFAWRDARAAEELKRSGVCTPFEKEFIAKGGNRVPVLMGIALLSDSRDDCVCFVLDLTDRKRAEQALRASEEQYRRIVETANEGVWLVGPEGRTTYVNCRMAGMLGYSTEEMLDHPPYDFMYEEDRAAWVQRFARRTQGACEQYEARFRSKDGSELWVMVNTSPIVSDEGAFLGSLGMITDITQRKRVAQELEAARQQLLSSEVAKKQFTREVLRAVTGGKFQLVEASEIPEPGELLAQFSLENPDNYARLRQHSHRIASDSGMPPEQVGELMLAVGEAASNAIKHAVGGSAMIFRATERIIVRISDHGPGIRPEDLPATVLQAGFSTKVSLGMGYTLMLKLVDTVWLATAPTGTVVQIEKWLQPEAHEIDPLQALLERF